MKVHEMRLHEEPFRRIELGLKTVEYRVNDEKRRTIQVGDKIIFYKRPEEVETIEVQVTSLNYYDSLLEMYTDTFDKGLKDRYQTPQEAVDDTPYYSEEEIKRYGCVAISFQKLS